MTYCLYSAQAGFNRGDGSGFYALPGSGTSEILALGNTSYVNMSGVWLFRVDGDVSIGGKFLCINCIECLWYGLVQSEFVNC